MSAVFKFKFNLFETSSGSVDSKKKPKIQILVYKTYMYLREKEKYPEITFSASDIPGNKTHDISSRIHNTVSICLIFMAQCTKNVKKAYLAI